LEIGKLDLYYSGLVLLSVSSKNNKKNEKLIKGAEAPSLRQGQKNRGRGVPNPCPVPHPYTRQERGRDALMALPATGRRAPGRPPCAWPSPPRLTPKSGQRERQSRQERERVTRGRGFVRLLGGSSRGWRRRAEAARGGEREG